MTIPLGNHFCLGVSGIALHCLDISAGQNQLVCDTAVAQAVKGYFGKALCKKLLFQHSGERLFL